MCTCIRVVVITENTLIRFIGRRYVSACVVNGNVFGRLKIKIHATTESSLREIATVSRPRATGEVNVDARVSCMELEKGR